MTMIMSTLFSLFYSVESWSTSSSMSSSPSGTKRSLSRNIANINLHWLSLGDLESSHAAAKESPTTPTEVSGQEEEEVLSPGRRQLHWKIHTLNHWFFSSCGLGRRRRYPQLHLLREVVFQWRVWQWTVSTNILNLKFTWFKLHNTIQSCKIDTASLQTAHAPRAHKWKPTAAKFGNLLIDGRDNVEINITLNINFEICVN